MGSALRSALRFGWLGNKDMFLSRVGTHPCTRAGFALVVWVVRNTHPPRRARAEVCVCVVVDADRARAREEGPPERGIIFLAKATFQVQVVLQVYSTYTSHTRGSSECGLGWLGVCGEQKLSSE